MENNQNKTYRVEELSSLCEENKKVYRLSDGTQEAVFTPKAAEDATAAYALTATEEAYADAFSGIYGWSDGGMYATTTHMVGVDAYNPLCGGSSEGNGSGDARENAIGLPFFGTVHGEFTNTQSEIWYSFMTVDPVARTFTFATEGISDTVGTLYDDGGNVIIANDDANGLNFSLTATLMMGRTYYLKVSSYSGKTGSFDLTVTDDGSRIYFANRMYLNLSAPSFSPAWRIKRVTLAFDASDAQGEPALALYKLASTVSANTSVPPAEDAHPIDVIRKATDGTCVFDVTSLVESGASCGLVVRALNETLNGERYVTLGAPELRVTYESSYAIDSSRAEAYELSRFGRAFVDLKNGNLMLEGEDFAWAGNRMPVSLRHLYNSTLAGYAYTRNDTIGLFTADFGAMKLGKGFKLNLMQSMVSVNGKYLYLDENGNERYFAVSADDENVYIPEDEGDAVYNKTNHTLTEGDTTLTFDASGRLISEKVGENQSIYTYANGRLAAVTDAAGRAFILTYNGDYLASITAPDETQISYTYTGERLTGITYPDGRRAVIAYTENKPITVTLKDGNGQTVHKLSFAFANNRVSTVTEYGKDGVLGNVTAYTYSAAARRTEVAVTEPADESASQSTKKTVYTFDEDGSILSEYVYTPETGNVGMDGEVTQRCGENLLKYHNFESTSIWNHITEARFVDAYEAEGDAKYGKRVMRLQTENEDGVYQVTNTLDAGEYVFSAYVRVVEAFEGDACGAYIRVTDANGGLLGESERLTKADGEYTRLALPFVLTSSANVNAQLLVKGKGTAYVDGVQLENNAYATPYNMLENSGFEWDTAPWTVPSDATVPSDVAFHSNGSLCLVGSLFEKKTACQSVSVKTAPSVRETFVLSGWAKCTSLPSHGEENDPIFRLCAEIVYEDGEKESFTADFSPATEEWQFASVEFSKSAYKKVESLNVYCEYSYNYGNAYFDGISLVRRSIEEGLSEEDFLSGEVYDDTYTTSREDTAEPFEEAKDAFGNALTETTFTDGELGTIYRAFSFAENGNDLLCETDARGNDTAYTVDAATSRNEEITDRCGNKTAYEYDAAGRTTKVTSKNADGVEIASVSYAYDTFDNMTEIARGDGMKYALAYNAFHNLESIGVEGKAEKLISYTYKSGSGRLKQMTYANGHTMKATYNALGQMVAEKWFASEADAADSTKSPTKHYKYTYDGEGNIVRSIDITAEKEYTYIYENGALVRATEADITLSDEVVASKVIVNTIKYYYNGEGNLTKKVLTYADGNEQTVYYENSENNTVVKFSVGENTVTSHSKTDSFGRKIFDELQLGTGFLSREFSYHKGEVTEEHTENGKLKSSPTTQLVSKILLSDGRSISYEYDAEERITKVVDSTLGETVYTYDALGQLLTERHNGQVVNSMTYDTYGNILSKNGKAYTYGDANWKDLLTAVDGEEIVYDAQGNPTNYFGHTLTWEKGRQLASFDGNTYTYNANGIRTSKTVNGVLHTYTLDGTKILREVWDENTLVPLYDNEDSVCGIVYNGVPYYFLKNLQGDVIAIANRNGETVAEYAYDAWGVPTILSDTTGIIASINPYRYRSYYYDAEIAKYYLQSRYYDAVLGRFINGDEALYIGLASSVLKYNIFTYCDNNTPNLNDLTGHFAGKALFLPKTLLVSLSDALPKIMSGISVSMASIKTAIATSLLILVCVVAVSVAIVGIIYVVNQVIALMASAAQTASAVKSVARSGGIDPKKLRNYTVYIIVRKRTIDVVYVGITKRYATRQSQHQKRFPKSQFTMMPIATGLTKNEARAMEQTIITAYTLDTLVNMINSISPKKWSTFKSEFEQMSTLIQSWIDQE